jgi:hypothetical protein
MKKVCEMLAWYKILYYLCNRERERQTLHDSKFNHKTNTIMKAIDFLTVTKTNEVRYSDYILFKADEAVTVEMFGGSASPARLVSGSIPADTAMVGVYDSELLGCLNEAGAKADAVVRVEDKTPYFVLIYSLE